MAISETTTEAEVGRPAVSAAATRQMLLIFNPHASTVSPQLHVIVRDALAAHVQLEVIETTGIGDATKAARAAAAAGFDAVIVLAGDGTINEAANGLIGTETLLVCLPGGSGNVYNRVLGYPTDIVEATGKLLQRIDRWTVREVRVGVASGRRFLFSCGIGLDASISKYVDERSHWKHRFRQHYFAYSAFKVYADLYRSTKPLLETYIGDGQDPLLGVTTVVQKASPYTFFGEYPLIAGDGSDLTRAELSGVSLRTARPISVPSLTARLFSRGRLPLTGHRQIDAFNAVSKIRIGTISGRPMPMHVDGDWIGDSAEVDIGIDPLPLLLLS